MRIGVDASGKFSTSSGFESTVVAAAVATDQSFREIGDWAAHAVQRWGIADKFDELHAKKLRSHEKLEICQMLAERGDVRLAAVVTDPGLLGSAEAVALHRRRQHDQAEATQAETEEGKARRRELLELLDNPALQDGEYLLAACLPMVLTAAAQQAFCFFRTHEDSDDLLSFVVRIDEDTAPTMRYSSAALLPTLGGDERFHFRFAQHWAEEPQHPFYARTRHPDGDGVWPQKVFDDADWASSAAEPAIQVADVAAWILARRINHPAEAETAAAFELLRPLFAGERGRTFELFSVPRIRPDQAVMYQHLQFDQQPPWWLEPVRPAAPAGR